MAPAEYVVNLAVFDVYTSGGTPGSSAQQIMRWHVGCATI